MLNGKVIRIPMIKKGIEKRTFICSLKLLILSPSWDRRDRLKRDRYIEHSIFDYYE